MEAGVRHVSDSVSAYLVLMRICLLWSSLEMRAIYLPHIVEHTHKHTTRLRFRYQTV